MRHKAVRYKFKNEVTTGSFQLSDYYYFLCTINSSFKYWFTRSWLSESVTYIVHKNSCLSFISSFLNRGKAKSRARMLPFAVCFVVVDALNSCQLVKVEGTSDDDSTGEYCGTCTNNNKPWLLRWSWWLWWWPTEDGFGGKLAGVDNNVDNQIPEIIVAVDLFLYNITFRCCCSAYITANNRSRLSSRNPGDFV